MFSLRLCHTVLIISVPLSYRIFRSTRKLSDSTHYHRGVCSSGVQTAVSGFSKSIFLSSGFASALGKCTKFPVFLAVKYTPIRGFADITKLSLSTSLTSRTPDPFPCKVSALETAVPSLGPIRPRSNLVSANQTPDQNLARGTWRPRQHAILQALWGPYTV